MGRRRAVILSLTSALIAGALVYCIYLLQMKQVQLQQTVRILVPRHYIEAGTTLTSAAVRRVPILSGSLNPDMLHNPESIDGMETMIPLGKGEPILRWKLDRYHLTPGPDQETFRIPPSYILTISDRIRTGDQVMLYASGTETHPVRVLKRTVTVASLSTSTHEDLSGPEQSSLLSRAKGNRQQLYASRHSANGGIAEIDLNLSEQEWYTIDQYCQQDKQKLVIAYSPKIHWPNTGR